MNALSVKPIRIKMLDASTNQSVIWTIFKSNRQWNVTSGKKSHYVSGWSFRDHEGYERFVEGNWLALVDHFRLVADNYGFQTSIS